MKKIPIGISDFKTIIDENYYYIDKSLFIKEIIDDGAKVILLPRPRRFGKTLNMSMLRYFYEKTEENNGKLFEALEICKHEEIMSMQAKYPVIYLTFKDEKYSTWEDCRNGIQILISNLYREHEYLLKDDFLDEYQRKNYINVISKEANIVELSKSLSELCHYLYKYHKTKAVILIDEYDVPIQAGFLNNYYDKIIEFMRNFLSSGLKDNIYLEKAVLTGILRVSKESIFSGLNNLKVSTLMRDSYASSFGFIDEEVINILKDFSIDYEIDEVRSWYNGYIFGSKIIYNPWSIINYVDNYKDGFRPYWVNTSSNDLVKKLLTNGGEKIKQELESLVRGEEIVKVVNEDIVMNEIDKSTENVWSFLLFSGYLKVVKQELKNGRTYCNFKIPNLEVLYIYEEIIMSWFNESIDSDKFNLMLQSLVTGDIKIFTKIFKSYVLNSLSYFDVSRNESEKVYHAFVLGMLVALSENYEVKSNRESGYGRYDVMIIPKDHNKLGIVIEFKKADEDDKETLEDAVEAALKQIKDKKYSEELKSRNVQNIIELGIAFQGKEVMIKELSRN
ncbi:MAG: AAA family ATPase [Bacillota bacterium]|nr:AAA family ATPase [Bacillota bacterium]